MYIQQKHLLSGLDHGFVKKIMEKTEKKTYERDDIIFQEGHHASRFYVLVHGSVKLTFGSAGQVVFTINHAGEAFGWSSLLGRNLYSATAQCVEPSKLIRIDRVKFNMVLDEDPANGLILVRRLAALLGDRLNRTYQMLANRNSTVFSDSYGSGQTMELIPPI